MIFYLGTHQPSWLEYTDLPLFVSAVRLRGRKTYPVAKGPWALDSGGFSELSKHGRWRISTVEYVAEVRKWASAIGKMDWAAAQDWMCEPFIVDKTGLSVRKHQLNTVENFVHLMALAPEIPWVPVIQGLTLEDYLDCLDAYSAAGVDLFAQPKVGLGSICRRQGTAEAEEIVAHLASLGLKLHGFGFKLDGLRRVAHHLASADSMAWSFAARYDVPLPGHAALHKNCANCLQYALNWRERVVATSAIEI